MTMCLTADAEHKGTARMERANGLFSQGMWAMNGAGKRDRWVMGALRVLYLS